MVAEYSDHPISITSNCYMVLDIGGGTVDIAIHNLQSGNHINSILPPKGNEWGGTTVNKQFAVLLQNIANDNDFEKFCKVTGKEAKHKAVVTNLVNGDFETQKKAFGKKAANLDVNIRLEHALVTFYQSQSLEDRAMMHEVEIDDDAITVSTSKMEQLFKPAVEGILRCMSSAFTEACSKSVSVDTIYLVGGFGGCPYIHKKIKEEVQKQGRNVQIIVPFHHKVAVVEGAVIFRQNISAIKSRVSDAYYGILVRSDYDANKHEYARRVYYQDDDCYLVNNVFDIFINKDQTVRFDEKFEKTVYPAISTDTSVSIRIYRTTKDGVKYLKDVNGEAIPGIEEIGKIIVDAPISGLPLSKRNIEVEFLIGGTELRVKAVYGPTKEEVNTVLDFLSIY